MELYKYKVSKFHGRTVNNMRSPKAIMRERFSLRDIAMTAPATIRTENNNNNKTKR